ncbi:MAG: hypothetical protein Q4C01_07575, partial [Clostridia bacterium]|nr:hypothetical protein [Clostridia bacterium]
KTCGADIPCLRTGNKDTPHRPWANIAKIQALFLTKPQQSEREACSTCNKPNASPNWFDYFVKKKQ